MLVEPHLGQCFVLIVFVTSLLLFCLRIIKGFFRIVPYSVPNLRAATLMVAVVLAVLLTMLRSDCFLLSLRLLFGRVECILPGRLKDHPCS